MHWLVLSALSLLTMTSSSFLIGAEAPSSAPAFTYRRGVNVSHWLSQNNDARPYGAPWFTREDVAWIAGQGFDHLRVPVDGRLWLLPDGALDESKIKPFEAAMGWAREHGLGTILDMHFLPGADFNPGHQDNTLFTDPAKMEKVADFWRRVARRYAGEGPWLRFELLNEPVAEDNKQVNAFNRAMIAAVRESNPARPVYITSNRWGSFTTVEDVEMPADPAVFLTLHFYEPFIFTHQRAGWSSMPPDMPIVPFPGKVPDMSRHFPADHWAAKQSGRELSASDIESAFDKVAAWVATHAAGREVYIGEFGVYLPAADASKEAYAAAVRAACEKRGWGWAVWDYRGGFAVRDRAGSPTAILRGLFPPPSP